MKKLPIMIVIILVLLSLLGNSFYYNSKQLSQPIMLKHYYEIPSQDDIIFELHYITNKDGKNDIQSISIPELNGYSYNSEIGSCKTYKYYCLKTISVKLNRDFIHNKNIHFTKVHSILSNGKNISFPIGEISIVKDSKINTLLDNVSSSASSDQTGEQLFIAKEPLSIQSIEMPFSQQLKNSLHFYTITDQDSLQKVYKEMTVGHWDDQKITEWKMGKDQLVQKKSFPITLKKDDYFNAKYQFSFEKSGNGYNYYQLAANLQGKTEKGKDYTTPLWINYSPYFSQENIDELVKQRREIDQGTSKQ